MNALKIFCLALILVLVCVIFEPTESRAVPINNFHSDIIVTHWPTTPANKGQAVDDDVNEPGFMRKQLMKFGQAASNVGNVMGTHATKISSAVDKVCDIVKLIIPLLAAICRVGQFKFCAATTSGPAELSEAMSPSNLDLNILDK
ncbi:uncharacterized protein LOC108909081 [Anoplophora glabripennis]|uniref:uncharacterized protein LOC108909081 n=1 Tax=Anoplophora glabripennis TaxID=217634 RepID=UPI000873E097|nr:uncharacterized protein LOC108909081 [Anoplophora glabripennis]